MADELFITTNLDASGITAGMEQVTSVVQSGTEKVTEALSQVTQGSVFMQDAVDKAITVAKERISQLAAAQEAGISAVKAYEEATRQLVQAKREAIVEVDALKAAEKDQFKTYDDLVYQQSRISAAMKESMAAEKDLALQTQSTVGAITSLRETTLETAAAVEKLTQAQLEQKQAQAETAALGQGYQANLPLGPNEEELKIAAKGATAEMEALDASVAQVTEQLLKETEATLVAAKATAELSGQLELFEVNLVDVDSTLTDSVGQMELFADAAETATGQLNLFDVVSIKTVGALEQVAAAQKTAAASGQGFNLVLAEGITLSRGAAEALDLLNNNSARGAASAKEVDNAWKQVLTELDRLNLGLRMTANGLEIVTKDEIAAAAGAEQFSGAIAFGAARVGAMELGVGRLGYVFGILSRAIAPLTALMNVLFAPILAIAFVDIVSSLVDKFDKMQEHIDKSKVKLDDLTASAYIEAEQMELVNLKLEDQISKLETGAEPNKLQIQLKESRIEAEKLAKQIEDLFSKLETTIDTTKLGAWQSAFNFLTGKEVKSEFADNIRPKIASLENAFADLEVSRAKLSAAVTDADKKDAETAVEGAEKRVQAARSAAEKIVQAGHTELNNRIQVDQTLKGLTPEAARDNNSLLEKQILSTETLLSQTQRMENSLKVREALREQLGNTEKTKTSESLRDFQAYLDQYNNAQDASHKLNLEGEIKYWQAVHEGRVADLNGHTATEKQKEEVEHKLSSLLEAKLREDIESTKKYYQEKINATKAGSIERINLIKAENDALLKLVYEPEKGAGEPGRPGVDILKRLGFDSNVDLRGPLRAALAAVADALATAQRESSDEYTREFSRGEENRYNAARRGSLERIQIAEEELRGLKTMGKEHESEYNAAENRITRAKKEYQDEQFAIAMEGSRHESAMRIIAIEEDKRHYELRVVNSMKTSQEVIKHEIAYSNAVFNENIKRLDSEISFQQARIKAGTGTLSELTKLEDQRTEMIRKHTADVKSIQDKALTDRMQLENSVDQTLERGIAGTISSMVKSYKDLQNALKGIYTGLIDDFAQFLAKKLTMWIEHHILEKIWAKIFGDQKDDSQTKTAKTIAQNVAVAQSDAAVSAAETLAYYAVVDPVGAVAAAEAMYGVGLMFAGLAAFDYGGIMPNTGVALVHQGEGVLTAPTTNMLTRVNEAVNSGGMMGGGHTFHFNIPGTGDPEDVANRVFHKVKTFFRTGGVIKHG